MLALLALGQACNIKCQSTIICHKDTNKGIWFLKRSANIERENFMLQNSMWFHKKNLSPELPHDPEIPLLGVYPKELKVGSWTDN